MSERMLATFDEAVERLGLGFRDSGLVPLLLVFARELDELEPGVDYDSLAGVFARLIELEGEVEDGLNVGEVRDLLVSAGERIAGAAR